MYCEHRHLIILFIGLALSDSLGRVANVSLERDVCKQVGVPVSSGGLGSRRAGEPCLLFVPLWASWWKLFILELR